jgi:hypothetical protein
MAALLSSTRGFATMKNAPQRRAASGRRAAAPARRPALVVRSALNTPTKSLVAQVGPRHARMRVFFP